MRKYFQFQNAAKINCGEDALSTIGKELSYLGASKPLLLVSENAEKLGVKEKVLDALTRDGIREVVTSCVPASVEIGYAKEQKQAYIAGKCDAIVAVGGDEVMDTAKCIKLLLSQEWDDILPVVAECVSKGKEIPLIAIPSENGAGKEANGYLEVGEYYLASPALVPNVVVIDEAVTMAAPAREVAASGVYALANAIEAYIETEETDVASVYAEKATVLLSKYLLKAVRDSGDVEACRAAALATTLAGVAYGANPFGSAHALAEGLAQVTGEPLEEMFSLTLLPAVKKAKEKYENRIKTLLFHLSGADVYAETPDSERAGKAIGAIEKLLSELHKDGGVPTRISATKITREKFGLIADAAVDKRASITAIGPIEKATFLEMLNDAY